MGNMKKAEMYYLLKVKEFSGWLKDQNGRGKFVWSTSNSYKEKKVPPQFKKISEKQAYFKYKRQSSHTLARCWLSCAGCFSYNYGLSSKDLHKR
jgi:hypothetical protein